MRRHCICGVTVREQKRVLVARLIASVRKKGLVRKKGTGSSALLRRPSCSVRLPGSHPPWPTSPGRPRPAARWRLRQALKRAPQRGGAPGRHRGAARASGAFPQVPWTAPTRGARPRPPATRRTSSPGRSAPPCSSQVPRPAGAREGRGGWRGRRGRAARAAGARVLGAGLPPPQQPGSPRAVASQAQRRAVSSPLGRRLARSRPPAARLLPVAARAGTGASGCDATFLVGISSRLGRSVRAALH